MGLSAKQVVALRRNLDQRHVRTRSINGRELSYIEGWHAIAEANRIFGFDGWSRETLEARCVVGRESRGTWFAVYLAKVRITVHAQRHAVIREGHGTGEGRGASAGAAHDVALKAAETDATKRALATFGKPFGLSLYLGRQARGLEITKAQKCEIPVSRPNHLQSAERLGKPPFTAGETIPTTPAGVQASVEPSPTSERLPGSDIGPAYEAPLQLISSMAGQDEILTKGPKRYRDRTHLAFVASQPCLVCGREPSDPHHLRFAQTRAMGLKVSDEFTVPLCRIHHRQLHQSGNEVEWWNDMDIDALEIAKGLWAETRLKQKAS